MSLAEYRGKRRFKRTAEPKGEAAPVAEGRRFVIQQHAARRLHFDLRLELAGTLKSWAVPKGISLDPADRRLAVHVEDHPLEYATFEGTIPEGEYGAGTVIVWDQGEWEPLEEAHKSYRDGKIKFRLHGEKLEGAWMLVRMRRKPEETADNWLLIKERDEFVVAGHGSDILRERPESALTGRTLAEVTAGLKPHRSPKSKRRTNSVLDRLRETEGAALRDMPASIEPALGRLTTHPPAGDQWLHEIKFDGYRVLAWLEHGQVRLRTRRGLDWTARFSEIAKAVAKLPTNTAIFDGEVVATAHDGLGSFSALQQALSSRRTGSLVYHVFDVVYLEGFDLRQVGLEDRKALLEQVLAAGSDPRVQFVEHVAGNAAQFFKECQRLELEGMLSKRRNSPYRSGRSDNWLKLKCVQVEPFVIGGFATAKNESRLRSLLVGYHDDGGRLVHAGRVGSGFTEQSAADLERRLKALERPESPFSSPVAREPGQVFHWVRPQLVAQVRFAGWTSDGILWHPRFEALRDDTDPLEVIREIPMTAAKAAKSDPPAKEPAKPRAKAANSQPVSQSALDDLAQVPLTTPQKVLYPEVPLTKLDLVKYYLEIADWILPHIIKRPLTLVRCPDGQQRSTFYQKHAGPETPKTVHRIAIEEDGEVDEHLFIDDLKGLLSLVQVAALEIHVWGARIDAPEKPDRMIIDLDPDEAVPFSQVIEAAGRVRQRLDDAGLVSFVKTTGGKGLHVVVPLERRQDWDTVKQFSRRLAEALVADSPQSYTVNMSKRARPGKIYIDYLRNRRGATAVAPYSTRARPNASVAVPVSWDELTPDLRPDAFTVQNLRERLAALEADPWAEMAQVKQALTSAVRKRLK